MFTVLNVEHDEEVLKAQTEVLTNGGYNVLEACNGEECIKIYRETKPDIILLDAVLPDINGIEVCKRLRAAPESTDLFILLISASQIYSGSEASALEAGADGCITKPISPEVLLAHVRLVERLMKSEEELRTATGLLEDRVNERTRELEEMNEELHKEIAVRQHVEDELLRSRANLLAVVESTKDMIWSVDNNLRLVSYNSALIGYFERNFTTRPSVGARTEDLLDTELAMRWDSMYSRALTSGHFSCEYQLTDGSFVDLSFNPIVKGKETVGVAVIGKDITDRKHAESNIKDSEARYRYLFDQNPVPMLIYEVGTLKVLAVNDAFVSHYGYSKSDALELHLTDLHTKIERDAIASSSRVLRGHAYVGEWHHLRKDGTAMTVEVFSHGLTYEGKPALVDVIYDISDRKLVEEALRQREKQITLIYDTVGDAIFNLTVGEEGEYRFASVNKSFLDTRGLLEEQVVGKSVQEVIPSSSLFLAVKKYSEAIREKRAVKWEETSDYPTGTLVGEVTVAPVFDKSNACIGLVGSIHDITKHKKAEEAIRRLNAELENRVLERTAELEASNQELESFSYSVSHDLRAPLRHASGFVDLLLKRYNSDLPEKGQHYLDAIADSVHHMGILIDDLLQFSRTSRTELRQVSTDMMAMVSETVEMFRQENPNRTIEWAIEPLPYVLCDPELLRLVWMNLLSNAVKFTRKKEYAKIEIATVQDGNEHIFFVRDNGVGFDMQYAHKLFGVFQRLHSLEEFEGTGIGLANVRRIIARHGGRTWAEGQVDGGAAFYFTLQKDWQEVSWSI